MEYLDISGRTKVTVLGFIGEFGHFGRKRVTGLEFIGELGRFGSQESHCLGIHWGNSDILGRIRITVLELIGDVGHFGSHKGHCFGIDWRIWTFWVSGGSSFWNVLKYLDILGLRSAIVLEMHWNLDMFGLN